MQYIKSTEQNRAATPIVVLRRLQPWVFMSAWLVASSALAQPPIGFERWTEPPDSGLVFGQEFADLFNEYSNPASTIHGTLFAPGIPAAPARRLIDIEIRIAGPAGDNVTDAVWVENSGIFQLDSWLLNRLTKAQLLNWSVYRGYIMVDIERYRRNGKTFWAAILQRNTHLVNWDILTDVTIDEINGVARNSDMRVVDVDFVGYRPGKGCPEGEACMIPIYDAVLADNTGANYMDWNLEEGWNYDPHVVSAAQLIDREKDSAFSSDDIWWSAYLSVIVNNAYDTYEFLSEVDVQFYHNHVFHRVIDLEVDPVVLLGEPDYPLYYTVNIVP